jgi:ribosomal protein L2
METAFGILLFVIVYGAVAFVIYDELSGKRAGLRRWQARRARQRTGTMSTVEPVRGGAARHTAARSRSRAPAQP